LLWATAGGMRKPMDLTDLLIGGFLSSF